MPRENGEPPAEFVWPPTEDPTSIVVRLDSVGGTESRQVTYLSRVPPPARLSLVPARRTRPTSVVLPFRRPLDAGPVPVERDVSRGTRPWLLVAGASVLLAAELMGPSPAPRVRDDRVVTQTTTATAPPIDPPVRPAPPLSTVEDERRHAAAAPAPRLDRARPRRPQRTVPATSMAPVRPAASSVARRASAATPRPVAPQPGETLRFAETVSAAATLSSPLRSIRRDPVPIDERLPAIPSPFPLPRGTRATVLVTIDEGGRVVEARLAGDAGPASAYDAPILAAARQWRYRPARIDGQPARATRRVDVTLR